MPISDLTGVLTHIGHQKYPKNVKKWPSLTGTLTENFPTVNEKCQKIPLFLGDLSQILVKEFVKNRSQSGNGVFADA